MHSLIEVRKSRLEAEREYQATVARMQRLVIEERRALRTADAAARQQEQTAKMRAALEHRKKEEEAIRLERIQDQLAAQQQQKDLHRALADRVRKSKEALAAQKRKEAERLRKEEAKHDKERERERTEELKANSLRYVSVRTNVEIGVNRSLSSLAMRRAADVEEINMLRIQREEEMRRRHVEETRALQARWEAMRSRPGTSQAASHRSPSSIASPSMPPPVRHSLPALANAPQPPAPLPEPVLSPVVVSSRGDPDSEALRLNALAWDDGNGGEQEPPSWGAGSAEGSSPQSAGRDGARQTWEPGP